MKRILTTLLSIFLFAGVIAAPAKDYYQILVYHFTTASQEKLIDDYLQQTFLPMMHASGYKNIGVFSPIANDTSADKKTYVLITLKNPGEVAEWNEMFWKKLPDQSSASAYWNSPYDDPPYNRMESILIMAWEMAPKMSVPKLKSPKEQHVYELRSYESATEKLFRNKVHMFNEGGEITLFARLNFNAVFYGDVLVGNKMPNLMYMTSFENMADRDAHWKEFVESPEWKKLIAMPEYQHNMLKFEPILMKAKSFSDF